MRIKYILLILFMMSSLSWGYTSIHQTRDIYGNLGLQNQAIAAAKLGRGYAITYNVPLNVDAKNDDNGNFCANTWKSFKLYIPGGTTLGKVSFVSFPNSNYRIDYRLGSGKIDHTQDNLAINSNVVDKSLTATIHAKEGVGSIYIDKTALKKIGNDGSWMYINIVRDLYHYPESNDRITNTSSYVTVTYYLTIKDLTVFNQWLDKTYFLSNGDPIERNPNLIVKNNSCSYGISESPFTITQGVSTTYDGKLTFVPAGSSPKEVCENTGKYYDEVNTKCITYAEKNCAGTWLSTENRCQTQDELNCKNRADFSWYIAGKICLKDDETLIATSSTYGLNISNFLANEEGWRTKLTVNNTNTSSRNIVKIKISNDNNVELLSVNAEILASDVWSANIYKYRGEIYVANESNNSIYASVKTTSVSGLINIEVSNGFSLSDVNSRVNIKKDIQLVPPVVESDHSAEQIACESSSNKKWDDEINRCTIISTGSSSSSPVYVTPTTGSNSNNEITQCTAKGRVWDYEINRCTIPSTGSSSSAYSYEKSSTTVTSSEEEECVAQGKEWNSEINRCTIPSKGTTGTVDLSDEKSDVEIIGEFVEGKTYPIDGYFIHYNTGSYDWVYVSASGELVAKLTGINDKNNITWDILKYKETNLISAEFLNDLTQIRFVATESLPGEKSGIVNELAESTFNVTGYFIHYDKTDSYGWIYTSVSGKTVGKLKGLNKNTGNMTWIYLENGGADIFSEIDVSDRKNVLFGSVK